MRNKSLQAVKEALQIPVLANGNIRNIHDVDECLEATGADGVMSADSLLEDPALFWSERRSANNRAHLEGCRLMLEYLELWKQYPVPTRMVRGHAFKMLGKDSQHQLLLGLVKHNTREMKGILSKFRLLGIHRIQAYLLSCF